MYKITFISSVILAFLGTAHSMEQKDEINNTRGIEIFAINKYYESPVRMDIGIMYKESSKNNSTSFVMQGAGESPKPSFVIGRVSDISNILICCYNDRPLLDESDATTLIAMKNYEPESPHLLKSLWLNLYCQDIVIKTAYNLPPLFSENEKN